MGDVVKSQEQQQSTGDRVLNLLRSKFPQYHPLLAIAELAHSADVKDDPRLQLECHRTLVKYVTPELKSIEVKADIRETRRVVVSMFEGEEINMAPLSVTYDAPILKAEKVDPMWDLLESREELAA